MNNQTAALLLTFASALASTPAINAAHAADARYEHNGSVMRVEQTGKTIEIYYERPRAGLSNIGVRSGTLLFNGQLDAGYLEGMSRVFSSRCQTVDYFVYGDFRLGNRFTLNGASPVRAKDSCRIVDNTYDGSNSNLVFTPVAASPSPSPTPAPVSRGCIKGVQSGSWLNARVGPGTNFAKIGRLAANSCGIVLSACTGGWCFAQKDALKGWVASRFIQR